MLKMDFESPLALYNVAATRRIELAAQATLAPHTLMQRAGLAVARLALAMAPHARTVWIACGPGNNGGDGLEAAMHLHRWGKSTEVTWLGSVNTAPTDAVASYLRAVAAGVTFAEAPPANYDLCIDALLGIGAQAREPDAKMANWIAQMNNGATPVLAVDIPSGLQADTGHAALNCVKASHTLSLLTLKPGLFTASGRDFSGTIWLENLSTDQSDFVSEASPTAWLSGATKSRPRMHASHKGSFGDVAIIGGALGMTGAALLAATAALHTGAGRVFVGLLDNGTLTVDPHQPELMFRAVDNLDFSTMTVVCGCGAGDSIHRHLAKILASPAPVVIDADAINQIAIDKILQTFLRERGERAAVTVLTPHPLEAARLMGTTTDLVQQNRVMSAQQLALRFNCTVVLKGSGTVIAAPGEIPAINPTGNARLASAGTGDVLAGMVGAHLACGFPAFKAACQAVYQHGRQAELWPADRTLTAGALARTLLI